MSIKKAYNSWSHSYDDGQNKTRDLEELVAKKLLKDSHYGNILELGCGTGKNTKWLIEKCDSLIALDFSEEMMNKAKQKITSNKVTFKQQDLTQEWNLVSKSFDLITCSLVLEHIKDLNSIFKKAAEVLKTDGQFYVCELHPFKQYSGSKARFDDGNTIQELEVYTHHITGYTDAAKKNGLRLMEIKETFDEDKLAEIPRLITFLFQK
jgi:ubiquinone/menaquinone biosynthesis C-methylase UbiE